MPPSFSCHEVKRNGGGDFTMDGSCNKFRPLPAKPSTTLSSENFYAATDIFAVSNNYSCSLAAVANKLK